MFIVPMLEAGWTMSVVDLGESLRAESVEVLTAISFLVAMAPQFALAAGQVVCTERQHCRGFDWLRGVGLSLSNHRASTQSLK